MGLSRRNVLVGLGALVAGGGALVGTGAFTTVQAQRTVNVETAGDASAFLALVPGDNDEYVDDSGDTIQINLDGTGTSASGLNQNAITRIEDIVTVTNNGTQDVTTLEFTIDVTGTSDDAAHENALSVTSGSATIDATGNDLLGPSGEGGANDDELSTGESVPFGLEVDLLNGGVNGDFESSANVTLTITAETA